MNTPASLSRRTFLRTAALAALAPAGLAAAESRFGGDIDGHVHVWTSDTQRYPLAHGFKQKDMKPPSFTPAELFSHCRPLGVNRIVLVQMNFYGFDNRYLLNSIARHPENLRGIAIIDEKESGALAKMKTLRARGIRGFRLYATRRHANAWLDSPAMQAMWSTGADLDMSMCLLADPGALPAIAKMHERFPKTRVVIDHFGRLGMKHPVRPEELDNLCHLARNPHTYLKISAFYALGAKKAPYTDLAPLIQRLHGAYGSHRLLWGSDCPYQVQDGNTYADSINLIRHRLPFLSAEDKEWMLRRTAERVFFS